MPEPRVIVAIVYAIAFIALIVAIWRQVGEAESAEQELERRRNRTP